MNLRGWLAQHLRNMFFDLAYWRRPRWDTGITPPEVVAFVDAHPAGRALDLGCGTGTNLIFLAQHGWEAWGVDFANAAVHAGQRKTRSTGLPVHLRHSDITKPLGIPGSFNLVLDIGCLHSIPVDLHVGYFSNLFRLLEKDGHYLLYGFIAEPSQPNQPGLHTTDFEHLGNSLHLEKHVEGIDSNGRCSVWVDYLRK